LGVAIRSDMRRGEFSLASMSSARDESCRPGWPSPHLFGSTESLEPRLVGRILARCRAGAGPCNARGAEPV